VRQLVAAATAPSTADSGPGAPKQRWLPARAAPQGDSFVGARWNQSAGWCGRSVGTHHLLSFSLAHALSDSLDPSRAPPLLGTQAMDVMERARAQTQKCLVVIPLEGLACRLRVVVNALCLVRPSSPSLPLCVHPVI
jgi:hypothetical protein